jgi:hypothetical protein
LARAYLPLIERMGPRIASSSVLASSRRAAAACAVPAVRLEALHLETRGAVQRLEAI